MNRLVYGMTRKGMEMYLVDLIDLNGQVESNATVTKLYEDSHGILWIGLNKGLCSYDVRQKRIKQVYPDVGHVMGIVENKEGLIWICTQDNGLFQTTADENFVLSNWTRISLVCLLLPIGFCGWELVTEESILMILQRISWSVIMRLVV